MFKCISAIVNTILSGRCCPALLCAFLRTRLGRLYGVLVLGGGLYGLYKGIQQYYKRMITPVKLQGEEGSILKELVEPIATITKHTAIFAMYATTGFFVCSGMVAGAPIVVPVMIGVYGARNGSDSCKNNSESDHE